MKGTAELRFTSALLGLALLVSVSKASFEPLPVGARAAGMGEAATAIVDDVYSLYYNPAGILQLQRPELGVYYSQLFVGLTDNSEISRSYFGYAQPLGKEGRLGGIGFSYMALDLPGLYKEEAIGITYGHEYKRLWNLGGTVKFLRRNIGTDDFTNNAIDPITGAPTGTADPLLSGGRSSNGIGLDLGMQYRLTPAYAMGIAIRNLNAPDMALGSEKDSAPAIFSAALARRLRRGSLDIEFTNWKGAENNTRFSLGGEHWFDNGIGLRAGGGFGSRNYATVSFGASLKLESIQFDYATIFPLEGVEDTIGTQQISLTVRLGKPPSDPLEQQLIKEKEQRIRAETEARYAKAERDRLKKRLLLLTQEKTEGEKADERAASARALKEAKAAAKQQAEKDQARKNQANKQKLFNDYTKALSQYNDQVRRGIDLKQKKTLLESIMKRFKDKGINIDTIERELISLRKSQTQAHKDFDLSMNFYNRLVEQGASVDERRTMLQRIIQKYSGSGINIKSALDERESLK